MGVTSWSREGRWLLRQNDTETRYKNRGRIL